MNSQERFTQICTFLDQKDWTYQPEPELQRLRLMAENEIVVIAVEEDGEYLVFTLPQLLTLPPDHPHYEAALETLAYFGWQHKLVRWQRDPDDGEVRVQADLPIEDSELTAKQFWRTLRGAVQIAQQGQERLQQVLATGQDTSNSQNPGTNQETLAFFGALLQAEDEGGETAVYQVLDQRGGQLDPQLPQVAQTYLVMVSTSKPEMRDTAVGLIENLAIRLQNYPRGRREINIRVAIALYQLVLAARPRETAPLDWAMTQNNLGSAYSDLPTGDRAANLQQAIACYEAALTVRKPDTAPLDWAATQNNLGLAYSNLPTGDRAANLQQAIDCYKATLTVWKQDTAPLYWAITQNNLGNAYSDLPTGDRAANLQLAIACYEAALTVWKPDTAPLQWAMTQNNLGNAYLYLPTGDRAANLQLAIACYKAALTVRKPDTAPLDWAMTQNNLGLAYSDLPTGDRAANLQQAIACYEAASPSKTGHRSLTVGNHPKQPGFCLL
ncbi:YbjN domain-containing protein [[Phormidium] sp. ETS-05]|uniref:YbjN domain-containing protein n=1 Tax=[Phormidium] sp. ETS-05 TaxID=222819 RepID=UPI0018EF109F|nr:YbjN domain-containing protein [[Phormidium] sp. ETS-05]